VVLARGENEGKGAYKKDNQKPTVSKDKEKKRGKTG
jgi:hypothetical protein